MLGMLTEAKRTKNLLGELERLAKASEANNFNMPLDIDGLPPEEQEIGRVMGQILSRHRTALMETVLGFAHWDTSVIDKFPINLDTDAKPQECFLGENDFSTTLADLSDLLSSDDFLCSRATLPDELERIVRAIDVNDFTMTLAVDELPPGEQEVALLFNRILNSHKAGVNSQEEMLKSILNGMEAHVSVCTPEDGRLLFLNDSIREYFGIEGDGVGQICYKLLQKRDEPCEACPYKQLLKEPDKTLTWTHRESVKGGILHKTARLIDWPGPGGKAHLEYAIDITALKKAEGALEHKEQMLAALNNAATIFLSLNTENFRETISAGFGFIARIAKIDRLSVFRNIPHPYGLHISQNYLWSKEKGTSIEPLGELMFTPYAKYIPRWKDILERGGCINGPVRCMPEADALRRFGAVTVLAVPVFNKGNFWGFVLFEDLTDERDFAAKEVDVLRSASFMLVNTIIRDMEGKKIQEADEKLKRMLDALEYQNRLLHTVNSISAILLQSDTADFEGNLLRSMGIMGKAIGADRVYIWENYVKDGELYCSQIYEWSENAEPQQGREVVQGVPYREVLPSWEKAFLQRQCINGIVREFSSSEYDLLNQQGIVSLLVVPIFLKEQFWGFVGFDNCHSERVFSENEEKILRSASELIANSLIRNSMETHILQLEAEVDKVFYDSLTGIYNRRFFDETMKRILRPLSRSGSVLSLMMIDIDHFKRFNDAYGHVEGDKCLKAIAETLQDSVTRADDFVARYGGEEFVAVLPNVDEEGVRTIAGRIMENIRLLNIRHEENDAADHVTVSIGVTTCMVEHTRGSDFYIKMADAMLYKSKQDGRNRCIFTL